MTSPHSKRTLGTTLAAALASTAFLGGCLSSLLPEPPPAPFIYRLSTPSTSPGTKLPGATVIRVDNVSAPRTYNTRDIIILTAERTLSAAEGALWTDDIPEILQDAMLSQLAETDNYIGVIPVAGARAELRLHLDVRDFSTVYDQGDGLAPLSRVHVYATVSEAASRDFVGSFDATGQARAQANTVPEIVEATSFATEEALQSVVDWLDGLAVRGNLQTG